MLLRIFNSSGLVTSFSAAMEKIDEPGSSSHRVEVIPVVSQTSSSICNAINVFNIDSNMADSAPVTIQTVSSLSSVLFSKCLICLTFPLSHGQSATGYST